VSEHTNIEWTDATWQPITGCSVVSPGCTNCYAMKLAGTRLRHHPSRKGLTIDTKAGPVWNGEMRFNEQWLEQPLQWRHPRKVFVCAHGDLFHESVPDQWIDRVFAVMALAPQHQFQVLTKRSGRMREYMGRRLSVDAVIGARSKLKLQPPPVLFSWPLPNVWLGISAEDQKHWDERKEDLRNTPAAIRFASFEPLLGPIKEPRLADYIGWAIAGGENGPRPMHPAWPRSLRDQCVAAGVPFFFKQWGSWAPCPEEDWHGLGPTGFPKQLAISPEGKTAGGFIGDKFAKQREAEGWRPITCVGKKRAGRELDGRTWNELPETGQRLQRHAGSDPVTDRPNQDTPLNITP
jgi:protein gp37